MTYDSKINKYIILEIFSLEEIKLNCKCYIKITKQFNDLKMYLFYFFLKAYKNNYDTSFYII